MLIVSPDKRAVTWLSLEDGRYADRGRSNALDITSEELVGLLEWRPGH